MTDAAFNNAYKKVKNCFKALKLSIANVEKLEALQGRTMPFIEHHLLLLANFDCLILLLICSGVTGGFPGVKMTIKRLPVH